MMNNYFQYLCMHYSGFIYTMNLHNFAVHECVAVVYIWAMTIQ